MTRRTDNLRVRVRAAAALVVDDNQGMSADDPFFQAPEPAGEEDAMSGRPEEATD